MRILVTGGAGFLGSELVKALSTSKRNAIAVFDSYTHGFPKTMPVKQNVNERVVGDIKDYYSILPVLRKTKPDTIVHLAAHITRPENIGQFRLCASTNYVGTANLLEACLSADPKNRPKRIVYASAEATSNPDSHYGVSKRAAGDLLKAICPTVGISLVTLRFAEIYGPAAVYTSDSLVNWLVDNMVIQAPRLAVFGANYSRSYIHIQDAVSACKLAIRKKVTVPIEVDISDPEPIKTKDLVTRVRKLTKYEGQIAYFDNQEVRVADSQMSPETATELLGFKHKVNFTKGLIDFVNKRRRELT